MVGNGGVRREYRPLEERSPIGSHVTFPKFDVHGSDVQKRISGRGYVLILPDACATCSVETFIPEAVAKTRSEFVVMLEGAEDEILRRAARDPGNVHSFRARDVNVFTALKSSWAPRAFKVSASGRIIKAQDRRETLREFIGTAR
jgi:hypothetical protein